MKNQLSKILFCQFIKKRTASSSFLVGESLRICKWSAASRDVVCSNIISIHISYARLFMFRFNLVAMDLNLGKLLIKFAKDLVY